MKKIGMAQIKNVLKIIKSKLGRFGQWLDEVYNPWMLRILVALTIAYVIFHVRNTIRTLTIEGYSKKIAWWWTWAGEVVNKRILFNRHSVEEDLFRNLNVGVNLKCADISQGVGFSEDNLNIAVFSGC